MITLPRLDIVVLNLCSFLLMLSLTASSGHAQCNLRLSELPPAPEFLGFRLEMTKEEIKSLAPQTAFGKTDPFGVIKTTINPSFNPKIDQKKFAGVRSISLELLDDRLTSLWIGYDETFKVQTLDEFLALINSSLHLPDAWSSWKGRGQQLNCSDFQLVVTLVARSPSLRIVETAAENTIAERRQAKEDEGAAIATGEGHATEEVIGDKVNHSFYPVTCSSAKSVSADRRVVFKNIDEAEKAGYKMATDCH